MSANKFLLVQKWSKTHIFHDQTEISIYADDNWKNKHLVLLFLHNCICVC